MKKIFLLLSLISTAGCSVNLSGSSPGSTTPTVLPELAACTTSTTYSLPVTVTGTASFYKRGLAISNTGSTITKITLSSPTSVTLPIKYAEVRVLNAAGTVVQCGSTNATGALKAIDGTSSLNIPNTPGSYIIQVLSRAQHTLAVPMGKTAFLFYTSVKTDIYSNQNYTLAQTVNSSGSGSIAVPSLIAYARESDSAEVNGGAFNIYNSILITYEYLAQNTGSSNLTCLNPKLDVFWKVGFNPAQYIYPSADPSTLGTLSFYVRGQNQLYINGGQLGNIKTADTDHFDDSVIIHELGHHIEDVCGKMDSPGGVHYGLYRIDARLAWSEGWGNFFGAHIIANNINNLNPDLAAQLAVISSSGWLFYLDTMGYTDSLPTNVTTGAEYIRLNLTKPGNNPEQVTTANGTRYYDKVDATLYPGEGLFRETSIARSLFKSTNTCASGCTGVNYFANIWQALENNASGIGMGKATYPFRSAARFYSSLNQSFSGAMPAAIDSILNTDEAQQRETNAAYTASSYRVSVPYGIKLVSSIPACSLKIQPRDNTSASSALNSNYSSDQRFSNHFYYVNLASLPGVTEIRLTATWVAGTVVDIDPILYNESYSFDEDCAAYNASGACLTPQKMTSTDMIRYDRAIGNGIKTLTSLNTLSPSANYLLDIRAYTTNITVSNTTEYTYTLTDQLGGYLCPIATY